MSLWFQLTAAATVCLAAGGACGSGPRDPSVFNPPVALTLAWDQPDGLAEYYHVKTGALLLRVDEPSVRLQLEAGVHVVEITSCNAAGCSPPTAVKLEYREGRWTLTALPPESCGAPVTVLTTWMTTTTARAALQSEGSS